MAVTADTWEELPGDDGRRARVLAALALSLACHALVLAGMRGWRVADPPPARLLVVTMAAGGGAPSKARGSMRFLIWPRRFMREVVSWPMKQPLWKSMPCSRSKLASMG